jgi:predicted nucleotidyltransferase
LFSRPEQSFYLRQVARLSGSALGATQRELKGLAAAGIVTRRVEGRRVYFQADPRCPVFRELKELMDKTAGAREALSAVLAPLAERIRLALIFGPLAAGRGGRQSDVPLLIVGDPPAAEIDSILGRARSALGRKIKPVIYSPDDFIAKADGFFIGRLIKGPNIFVIGNDEELKGLVRKRPNRRLPPSRGGNRRNPLRGGK